MTEQRDAHQNFTTPTPAHARDKRRGFTLIEVIVSIGIFVLLLSIVLLKYGDFQGNVLLSNITYQVALAVRQAQVYGIGVRADADDFKRMYALHFDTLDAKTYVFYSEPTTTGDLKYDGLVDSVIDSYVLKGGYNFIRICATTAISPITPVCNDAGSDAVRTLDIYYKRPNPDAIIKAYDVNGVNIGNGASARIEIGARGSTRCILITKTGQISASAKCS